MHTRLSGKVIEQQDPHPSDGLILFLLQPSWKHGKKNIPHILFYRPIAVPQAQIHTYPEQYQLSVEQSSSERSEWSRLHPESLVCRYVLFVHFIRPCMAFLSGIDLTGDRINMKGLQFRPKLQ
jgi:hypothetical protein